MPGFRMGALCPCARSAVCSSDSLHVLSLNGIVRRGGDGVRPPSVHRRVGRRLVREPVLELERSRLVRGILPVRRGDLRFIGAPANGRQLRLALCRPAIRRVGGGVGGGGPTGRRGGGVGRGFRRGLAALAVGCARAQSTLGEDGAQYLRGARLVERVDDRRVFFPAALPAASAAVPGGRRGGLVRALRRGVVVVAAIVHARPHVRRRDGGGGVIHHPTEGGARRALLRRMLAGRHAEDAEEGDPAAEGEEDRRLHAEAVELGVHERAGGDGGEGEGAVVHRDDLVVAEVHHRLVEVGRRPDGGHADEQGRHVGDGRLELGELAGGERLGEDGREGARGDHGDRGDDGAQREVAEDEAVLVPRDDRDDPDRGERGDEDEVAAHAPVGQHLVP
mmetsp:Transcript_28375/g.70477  ORF Transcript_28375/g.70477 Transcript_28375/m.70477 type:complete len:392 (+) Transcript_28375:434-1609(+)